MHGDGKASIVASVPFLQNYMVSLKSETPTVHRSGKELVAPIAIHVPVASPEGLPNWRASELGQIKVNVDAS